MGLSYPSQYGHKTVWHDNKVTGKEEYGILGTTLGEATNVQFSVKVRAYDRLERRLEKWCAKIYRRFGSDNK